jgi:hypothetical protein
MFYIWYLETWKKKIQRWKMLLTRNTNKKFDITNWQGDFAIWIEKQKQTPCNYLQTFASSTKKNCYKKINKQTHC